MIECRIAGVCRKLKLHKMGFLEESGGSAVSMGSCSDDVLA